MLISGCCNKYYSIISNTFKQVNYFQIYEESKLQEITAPKII